MRVLVAGSGGFIGGHLVKRLLDEGHMVRAVDIKPAGAWWQLHDDANNWSGSDLRLRQNAYAAVSGQEVVYNLAADMGGIGFIETNKAACMLSVLINTHLLLAARYENVKRYFYSSSACVYHAARQSDPKVTALAEEDAYYNGGAAPENGYGWEKLFSERMCRHFMEDYGIECRVARFHNIYGPCYDDVTEVLTLAGWKSFADLVPGDQIASRSVESDVIEYVDIAAFQRYWYCGPMYSVEHSAVSQMVTPDHALFATWPTTRHTSEPFTPAFCRHVANEIKWDRAQLYLTSQASWRGNEIPEKYGLAECRMTDGRRLHEAKQVEMRDWFEFIGWYLSEGSSWITPSNYTVTISQSPGESAQRVKALLEKMGFTVYVNHRNLIVSNKQLHDAVQDIPHGAHHKAIPRWMLNAPPALLQVLLDALMSGDGDVTGRRYSTVSKALADDVMEICLKLGKHAWIGREVRTFSGKLRPIFRVHISSRPRLVTKRKHRTFQQYDGMVYDVTLERNHVMLVRRDGKPCWSGNCGSWKDGREKAPAALCRKVAEAKASGNHVIDIWGDGSKTRSFCWVDDCVEGILRLTESDVREPLNIGSTELVSIEGLLCMIERIAGIKVCRVFDMGKPQGVAGRNSDNTKIRQLLGWEPSTSLADGLARTYPWIEEKVRCE